MHRLGILLTLLSLILGLVLCGSKPKTDRSIRKDARISYILHSLPANTESIVVITAPHTVFDYSIIQGAPTEVWLQLLTTNAFRRITSQLRKSDVLLSADCNLQPNIRANSPIYPQANFLFLRADKVRDIRIEADLKRADSRLSIRGKLVYNFKDDYSYYCRPKPDLFVHTPYGMHINTAR